MIQFYQSVSCGSSAVHGLCSSFGSPCSSVAGSVGSVVQSVLSVCTFAVADQRYQLKALIDCWDFLPKTQGTYIV